MAAADVHPIQRPLKGSRISSFYPVKEIPPLSSLDSAFQLQEYISLLIRKNVHDVDAIVTIPGKGKQREGSDGEGKGDDAEGAESKEVTVDESCWIYEQLRRLAQDLSHPLITMLQQECTRQTCPEMKAGEWLYLCVAHGTEGAMEQCCAIDYILHTLDSATSLLNSPRNFPSRLSIPAPSHRHFSSLARRLGRIFAHAYFHHRAAFAQAEAESALYARFLALTSRFELVPADFLVIPPGIVGYEEHDGPDEYPRSMLGAALDPQRERERGREDEPRGILRVDALGGTSPNGEDRREPSPRKMGRNRTDTMVHSEMASVVEELGRAAAAEGETEGTRERVSTIRPGDVHKKEEEATTAQEHPDVQTAAEPEPTTKPEAPTAPTEPENIADDSQAEPREVTEHIQVEPETTLEEPAPPAEQTVLAEETDVTTSTEPVPADVPVEDPADEPTQPDSHAEPIPEAEPEAAEAEEAVAHSEEHNTAEPETPDEAHEEDGPHPEPEPEPAGEHTEEEEPAIKEDKVAPAEAEEPAQVTSVQADIVEESAPEEAHEETTETKEEEGASVAEDEVMDAHPESHPEPEGVQASATEA
ncbi:hypothetical protein FOMPIDRAFT_89987 [Fomitopsis schrenkii]|uniref:Mob1/phocein n=1 Tax=Fomitopsis schrenkii TaxID=2126942 RepID=S8E3N1_FOMSC|nr:hypothetical protein FOMPIDRAFT_89987 [Fomitopsis schrenkii]